MTAVDPDASDGGQQCRGKDGAPADAGRLGSLERGWVGGGGGHVRTSRGLRSYGCGRVSATVAI